MATDTLKSTVIGLMVILLFIALVITFAIGMGDEYGRDTSNLLGDDFNITGVNNTLNSAEDTANEWKDAFTSGNIFKIIGLTVIGIFDLGLTILAFIMTPFTLIIHILINVLHLPAIIVGTIIMAFIVAVIFGIWSLWKKGD